MADGKQQVIVRKKYVKAEEHHGGAWKVAYADFVTAMMAFFLLLWLLNAVEQEVLDGVSNYFKPTVQSQAAPSGTGGMFGGVTVSDPGPAETAEPSSSAEPMSTTAGDLRSAEEGDGPEPVESTASTGEVDYEQEERAFNTTKRLMESALDELPPELRTLQQTLKVDITEEGLRIQILDNAREPSFERGTAALTEQARQALRFASQYIARLPNAISVTGHTDASAAESGDWSLSLARANAARRELVAEGLPVARFETVVGEADTQPLIPEEPAAAPNRRVGLLLIRRAEIPQDRPQAPALVDEQP